MQSPSDLSINFPVKPSGTMSTSTRPINNQRQPSNGLKLAPLPKYHPAVYRSPATSKATTPASRPASRGLLSPRTSARQFSEVQRQHQEYQRQMLATLRQTTALVGTAPFDTPSAPHLLPLDSPGPPTPLDLEESDDYLNARNIGESSPRELAAIMIREEQERRMAMRVDRSFPAISPRC